MRGELSPGERLHYDHIVAEFSASHVPVREAFRRLQAQEMLSTFHAGTCVWQISVSAMLEVYSALDLSSIEKRLIAVFHRVITAPATYPILWMEQRASTPQNRPIPVAGTQISNLRPISSWWAGWERRTHTVYCAIIYALRGGCAEETVRILDGRVPQIGRSSSCLAPAEKIS